MKVMFYFIFFPSFYPNFQIQIPVILKIRNLRFKLTIPKKAYSDEKFKNKTQLILENSKSNSVVNARF